MDVFVGVLEGIKELNGMGYMHCNVKPSNVLVKVNRNEIMDNKNSGKHANNGSRIISVKLIDFSLSRRLPTPSSPTTPTTPSTPDYQSNEWTPYMSPLTLITKTYH